MPVLLYSWLRGAIALQTLTLSPAHVSQDGQSRTIRQFQFTDWPEQGVPKTGEGFIDFIGQVHKTKEQFGQDGPITVHCRWAVPAKGQGWGVVLEA
jgi:protein tyrosine phosphatase